MDLRVSEFSEEGPENFPDSGADRVARSEVAELPRGLSEALADPMVQALMAADKIDRSSMEALMRRAAARLANGTTPRQSFAATGPLPEPGRPRGKDEYN